MREIKLLGWEFKFRRNQAKRTAKERIATARKLINVNDELSRRLREKIRESEEREEEMVRKLQENIGKVEREEELESVNESVECGRLLSG